MVRERGGRAARRGREDGGGFRLVGSHLDMSGRSSGRSPAAGDLGKKFREEEETVAAAVLLLRWILDKFQGRMRDRLTHGYVR